MSEEEYTCEECGDSFDSKRGLSSHKAQIHSNDEDEKEKTGETGSPKIMLKGIPALAAVFVVGLLVGLIGGSASDITGLNAQKAELNDQQPDPTNQADDAQDTGGQDQEEKDSGVNMAELTTEGEPMLGDEDAPVTMVMFEDFECPFCKRLEDNAFQQIKSEYVETGKVKVYWKDLPLPERIHPWASESAEAMECVYRQDNEAFWNVKTRIFENQDQITQENAYEKIKSWASDEGVDSSKVQQCIDSGDAMEEIRQDQADAESAGASGTPTVLVGGEKIVGAQPFSRFETVIESGLE